jgi:hypothetical protein
VTTNPGSIPPTPEWEKDNLEKKREGLRFCSREKKYKPERTHYCSAIGRNVLKMDHYCPWLANCVGFFNHKFFMLFIMYASVAAGWTTVSVAHLLATSSAGLLAPGSALSAAQIFFLTEGLCISSLISLILTPFTGFHLWLVAKNKTTLEYCERANPNVSYDFGIFFNLSQVFGYNPLFWFLPVQTAQGDGLRFEKRVAVTKASGDDSEDEEEARIRQQIAEQYGTETTIREEPSCCIKKWDSTDSPLFVYETKEGGGVWSGFLSVCFEINAFRDKCQTGFAKIVSGPSPNVSSNNFQEPV